MKNAILSTFLFFLISARATAGAIGEWTEYPAFGDISCVEEAGDVLYVLAGVSLYSVNTSDGNVTTYDKARTLSDTEIDYIAWCEAADRLVVVYSNQNIDLLDSNGGATNISDYYSKTMTEDKTVNGIDIYGNYAYLSTNFGIVCINVSRAEIANTYNLGIAVNWTHLDSERIYAESKKAGQYSALLSSNLLDSSNWTLRRGYTAKDTSIDESLLAVAESYKPNGPTVNQFGFLRLTDGLLLSVPGTNDTSERTAAIQIFDGDSWTVAVGDTGFDTGTRYRNIFEADIDPRNSQRWLAAAVPGLFVYERGSITANYYCENSLLERAATVSATNVDYTEVTTVKFDQQGNAWMLQGIASTPGIIKYDTSGNFTRYEHDELSLASYDYTWVKPMGLDFDSRGLLWFVNNDWHTPALASYDTGSDLLTTYTSFINQDNTDVGVSYARCWAEDVNGNIWVGTSAGPLYLAASDITSGGTTFQQFKVPREDDETLADYLLSGIDITCMAIDAGNRKWFGTDGQGVYVISSDNLTQEENFTSSTSPLPSDYIESIAIDQASGEVYVGTTKGLCSYSADVSEAMETLDSNNIYAYPNPVRPDYTGLITIVGLTYDADVKIVTSSGQLVAEGRSTGGTFTWDGSDLKGRRVASGVYIVFAATSEGKSGATCKIAIVR